MKITQTMALFHAYNSAPRLVRENLRRPSIHSLINERSSQRREPRTDMHNTLSLVSLRLKREALVSILYDMMDHTQDKKRRAIAQRWLLRMGYHLNKCTDCGDHVESVIGCPDGAEICQSCFDEGRH